jgi:hypothetical protein
VPGTTGVPLARRACSDATREGKLFSYVRFIDGWSLLECVDGSSAFIWEMREARTESSKGGSKTVVGGVSDGAGTQLEGPYGEHSL